MKKKIQYKNQCELLISGPVSWIEGELAPCDGGYFVTNNDGTILSVQPDGSVSTRPAGTNPGGYETCQIDSVINVLRFSGAGSPYALAYHGL
jgi:hypothetical protein